MFPRRGLLALRAGVLLSLWSPRSLQSHCPAGVTVKNNAPSTVLWGTASPGGGGLDQGGLSFDQGPTGCWALPRPLLAEPHDGLEREGSSSYAQMGKLRPGSDAVPGSEFPAQLVAAFRSVRLACQGVRGAAFCFAGSWVPGRVSRPQQAQGQPHLTCPNTAPPTDILELGTHADRSTEYVAFQMCLLSNQR